MTHDARRRRKRPDLRRVFRPVIYGVVTQMTQTPDDTPKVGFHPREGAA